MITKMFTKTEKEISNLKEVRTQTDSKTLNNNIEVVYKEIEKYVKDRNYRITYSNNETSKIVFEKLNENNLSQNRRKKIAKQIYYVLSYATMKKINTLLNLIYKTNESKGKYKITKSQKELDIQSKRKTWKEYRDLAEKARLEYIEEKGDFYKTKKEL
jgi:hypothetical protein